jgi:deferrochelatase/peroxidase EfeB
MAKTIPGVDGATLRSAIVGRKPDGQSLMRTGPEDGLSINHFFYAGDTPALSLPGHAPISGATRDVGGTTCPVWAHVRKVNPRDGTNDLQTEAHNLQMLRRGVPFGPAYDHQNPAAPDNQLPRGLLFLSYQRSISEQFEKLNSHWMNQFEVPAGGGHDLLVGLALNAGVLTARRADWPASTIKLATPSTWVRPTGGAYLFAPSIRNLQRFATTPGPD